MNYFYRNSLYALLLRAASDKSTIHMHSSVDTQFVFAMKRRILWTL